MLYVCICLFIYFFFPSIDLGKYTVEVFVIDIAFWAESSSDELNCYNRRVFKKLNWTVWSAFKFYEGR